MPQIPASGAELKLKQFRGHAQRSPVSCCICSKHGFQNLPLQTEVSLVFWTGVFLSSGRNYYNREGNRPKGRVFMGKLTLIQRQQAVGLFEQGYGYVLVSRMLELKQSQVELLSRMWRIHGRLCLMRRKNQQYSFETKKEVVTRYLQGDNPIELAKQYNISSDRLIRIWVKKWKTSGDVALRPRLIRIPTSKRYRHTTDRGGKTQTR